MDEVKCTECKNELVLGEKSQCIYCELTQSTGTKSCPKCTKSILRDKRSLYCELCKCCYHNSCNEFPLDDQYCTLLYEVPRNIKWFCDKCIWVTERWISSKTIKTRTAGKKVKFLKVGRIVKNDLIKVEDCSAPSNEDDKIEADNEKVDNVSIIKKEDTNYDSTFETDDLDYRPWESEIDSESEGRKKQIGEDNLKKKDINRKVGKILQCEESEGQIKHIGKGSLKKRIRKRKRKFGIMLQCDQCPKTFYKEHLFEGHKLWHTGDKKPYKCDLCTKCFAHKTSLDEHKKKHSGEYPYICNFCGIGKANSKLLKAHIISIHSEGILKCTLCDYQTKSIYSLTYHMKEHSGENCFTCDECGINLKSLYSLKTHQRSHTGEKPFKCEDCEKSFRHRSNLRVHMFVHSKEKKVFCLECGYGFPTKDKLDIHLKTVHTDEKPFECERCGNKYKTKHNLKNHKNGKRGSCHPMNTQNQKMESLQNLKSSSESNISDSNDSHLDPLEQSHQQPPLLDYAGGYEKTMASV